MKVEFISDNSSLYKLGDIVELNSYNGYSKDKILKDGILDVCYGHGDFEWLKIGTDIKILD